jgi:hypothetical protein
LLTRLLLPSLAEKARVLVVAGGLGLVRQVKKKKEIDYIKNTSHSLFYWFRYFVYFIIFTTLDAPNLICFFMGVSRAEEVSENDYDCFCFIICNVLMTIETITLSLSHHNRYPSTP